MSTIKFKQMQNEGKGFMSISTVLELIPVSKNTLYRMIEAGDFPSSLRISRGRVAWKRQDVDDWLRKISDEKHTIEDKK